MNLSESALSLLNQFPEGRGTELQKQEQKLERFGQIAFGGFGLVLLAGAGGIIYWIITKTVLTGEGFWTGLLLVAFIIFAVLTLTYVVLRESLKEQKQKLSPQALAREPDVLSPAPAGREIDRELGMSVVDDTTELLQEREKTRNLD